MFTTSIHTHVRSIFDAQIDARRLAERIIKLEGKGIVITDHGVLSSIEDYKAVFNEYNLKLIPGVELYVNSGVLGRTHLIAIAKNDNGYKAISKMVTISNKTIIKGFPVINKEDILRIAKEYKDDVIITSACVYGVLSAIFLKNKKIDDNINKLRAKQEKYMSPSDSKYLTITDNVNNAQNKVDELMIRRDDLKKLSEKKIVAIEKKLLKRNDKGEDVSLELAKLNEEKILSLKAKEELEEVKTELELARKELSKQKKDLKSCEDDISKYLDLEIEISNLKDNAKSFDELRAEVLKEANIYKEAFGNNFYIEVQNHGIDIEKTVFPELVKIARKLNIKLVASNDVHILTNSKEDRLQRQILRSLRYKEDFLEEQPGDEELYLKTDEELAEKLLEILDKDAVNEAIANIKYIFDSCNVEFKTQNHYPKFSDKSEEIFDMEIAKGITWRFPNGLDKEHSERLKYEIGIIKSMGYVDYHLVVKDFLEYGRLLGYVDEDKINDAPLTIPELKNWIKENNWKNPGMRIGNGRGSAVGSLVCYLLGITSLDPIKYGLLFERFLNPERVSMPDIDSDISNLTRSKVIEYVQNKYGADSVCGIMTINAQAPKGAVRIAAKYYGLKEYNEALIHLGDKIAKMITDEVGVSFAKKVSSNGKLDDTSETSLFDYLKEEIKNNFSNAEQKDANEILAWAKVIEGSFTAYGAHAAGIVISDGNPVSDYLPLRWNNNLNMMTTQCDMVQTEENGLLKFDFLGLKTLDIITECLKMIENNTGKIIDPYKINLEDKKVLFSIFAEAKTNAVFQFSSNGMKQMLKRFKPSNFEDLIILVSMFRPGPLQYLDGVIDVKNGLKPIEYATPELEHILNSTYGAIVYQEQVMQICQDLAGYTLGGADQVRRYMSKKKADKLAHERKIFVQGCLKKHIPDSISNAIFDQMMDFAKYAFNKSHAAAYAFNAYITGWLKYYYPAEFFAAALNWAADSDEISGLIAEANEFGINILPPDVNKSGVKFEVVNGDIIFALSSIKGVASNSEVIINERKNNGVYNSLNDFVIRTKLGEGLLNKLIDAGAFDSFAKNRKAMKKYIESSMPIVDTIIKKKSFIDSSNLVLPYVENKSGEELIAIQQNANLKAEIKEPTSITKLQKRINNANVSKVNAEAELKSIKFINLPENIKERMNLEKEALGRYITTHPMDIYPTAESLNLANISDSILENTTKIYGVITDLRITARKKDGAKMCFFKLTDKTSSVDVCVFTKKYALFGDKIEEGAAYIIEGEFHDEVSEVDDKLSFFANSISIVEEKKKAIIMEVPSYASFHIDEENEFINKHQVKNGRTFYIYDKALNEIRIAKYLVSENVLNLEYTREIEII